MTDGPGKCLANVHGVSPWDTWESRAFDAMHHASGDLRWPISPDIDVGGSPDWWPVREEIFYAVVLRRD